VSWDEPEAEPVTQAEPVLQHGPVVQPRPVVQPDDSVTEPMRSRADHLLPAPADTWHGDPVESWHSLLEDEPQPQEPEPPTSEPPAPEPAREPGRWGYLPPEGQGDILDELPIDLPVKPKVEPIGFAHNGFHVDEEQRFQPLPPQEEPRPSRHERRARHYLPEGQPEKRPFWFESHGRHSRDETDDASSYGRHSMPGRD
jgi:hypothetical protein